MQYTIRHVPKAVDMALRRRAQQTKRPLNDLVLEALAAGLGVDAPRKKYRSLRDLAGTAKRDRALDAALDDQRRIDPELWK